jgi:integrase
MAHVEDRWHKAASDGTQARTSRYGTGRRWRVRYADPDGQERNRSFDKKVNAERFRAEIEADVLRGTYMDPDAGKITLRAYTAQWLARQQFDAVTREGVESRIRLHILPVLGARRLDQLAAAPSAIEAWLSGVKLAPSTKRKVFTHLNTIMRAALMDGRIRVNPCQDRAIRVPKPAQRRVVPWTPGQRAAVRAALPVHLRAFIDAGCDLGLRQSELFALSAEEIEFLPRRVQVRQQVKVIAGRLWFAPPKGGKERTVPLAAPTALVLSAHLAEHGARPVTLPWHEPDTRRHGKPHTAALLFATADGRAYHRNTFNGQVWHPARKAAGLADGRENGCHAMRHAYASTLIARGVDVRTVAEYLGHSDGGALVLRTYSHLMPDAEDRARRAIEDALRDAESQADGPDRAPGQENRP